MTGDISARVAALSAQVNRLEARVDALESVDPSPDYARGLAELSDRIDARNPDRVPGNSVAELERRRQGN